MTLAALTSPCTIMTLAQDARLFPKQASTVAPTVDAIFIALTVFTILILGLIVGLALRFAIKYRAGSPANRTNPIQRTTPYELTWIGILLVIGVALFTWSAWAYYEMFDPPQDATTYLVTGQQWWWEIQHANGRREINELHVPVGRPVRLLLTSKDVIHSFYVPAFRTKHDAVPGRYATLWFTPTEPGEYHLFCAEYCGTNHSRMIGRVHVMSPADYAKWMLQTPPAPTAQPLTMRPASASFRDLGCYECHRPDTNALAPYLDGLFGRRETLSDGTTIVADEQYIRESILDPAAKVVRGYLPIMPTYKGQLTEAQVFQLVEAVRALSDRAPERSPQR